MRPLPNFGCSMSYDRVVNRSLTMQFNRSPTVFRCTERKADVFEARGKAKLNCPANEVYKTEVVVQKVNEAIVAGKAIAVEAAEFEV